MICIFAGQFRPAGHISPNSGLNSHNEYMSFKQCVIQKAPYTVWLPDSLISTRFSARIDGRNVFCMQLPSKSLQVCKTVRTSHNLKIVMEKGEVHDKSRVTLRTKSAFYFLPNL